MSHNEDSIRQYALTLGFDVCGFAVAEEVDDASHNRYVSWINGGMHSSMEYLDRYHDVRRDPRLLLDGAKTVIALAMNYYPPVLQDATAAQFAYYAYGQDYHDVVRNRLRQLAEFIKENYGGECRACVDTAPLRERYWAQRAGIGFIGRNNQLIIPNRGSYFFLAFLLTTVAFAPDEPCVEQCLNCGRCVKACPAKALNDDGTVDANRCISCLTIEHKGEFGDDVDLHGHLYGCDECQKCCPHNANATPHAIPEFMPNDFLLHATLDDILCLTPDTFREQFRHSAVRRAKLVGLLRNATHLKKKVDGAN